MRTALLAAICCLLLPAPSSAAEWTGKAVIVDGDTLELAGRRINLAGIDAPEADQTCRLDGGAAYPCGQMATFALAGLIETHWVSCRQTGEGPGGGVLATCSIGPYDVGAEMVRRGWALADRRVPDLYVAEEDAARTARAGLWQGTFDTPWAWRAR